jgi:hypothetical protein
MILLIEHRLLWLELVSGHLVLVVIHDEREMACAAFANSILVFI